MSISSPSGENPSKTNSLPRRWKVGRQRAAIGALSVIIFAASALQSQSSADQLDKLWLRARFSMREWLHNNSTNIPQVDSQIAIVEIDDKSMKTWSDKPLIMMGPELAKAIDHLNRSGARVIALDWMQSVETDKVLKWNHDEILGRALSEAKNVVFVKFVRPGGGWILPTPSLLFAPREAYLDGGASSLGFADLANQDGIQYAFLPKVEGISGGPAEVSFAARIAQKSGFKLPSNQPIRQDGSMLINFADNAGQRDESSPFYRASLSDLVSANVPDFHFKDKIVFIGATYKGNNDTHYIPFVDSSVDSQIMTTRKIAGVEVQAHAVSTMLQGKGIDEPNGIMVWLLSVALGAFGISVYSLKSWARAARAVIMLGIAWTLASFVAFYSAHYALPLVAPLLTLIFGCALMGGYRAFSEERERSQVMKIWGRYQDPTLIRELLENPDLRSGQGREAMVTVLFADLKNFTQTVEPLPPAQALEALNKYLAMFANVIRDHEGIVDKYLGDGLMAQWGAPVSREDHATAAVKACLEIQKQIDQLTDELKKTGQVTFEARLTLHTGVVIAGPLGADEKLEYTIIGDTVNVTSRLQETAKAMDSNFLISEMTCASMDCLVKVGRETTVAIRGRKAPLRVFEILGEEAV